MVHLVEQVDTVQEMPHKGPHNTAFELVEEEEVGTLEEGLVGLVDFQEASYHSQCMEERCAGAELRVEERVAREAEAQHLCSYLEAEQLQNLSPPLRNSRNQQQRPPPLLVA